MQLIPKMCLVLFAWSLFNQPCLGKKRILSFLEPNLKFLHKNDRRGNFSLQKTVSMTFGAGIVLI